MITELLSNSIAAEEPALVVIDWGTTNLRAFLVSNAGDVLAKKSERIGVVAATGDFDRTLMKLIDVWLDEYEFLIITLSGMVGSRAGWFEVPCTSCPTTVEKLAGSLYRVRSFNDGRCWIIPGAMTNPADGHIDIMRGEEVQLIGAIDLWTKQGKPAPQIVCLPGSHNKWVQIADGVPQGFATTLTGEVYDLLATRSLLAHSVATDAEHDFAAFIDGLACSRNPGGLLQHLFTVRTRDVLGGQSRDSGSSYLSGILIGSEIQSALPINCDLGDVGVVGSSALIDIYRGALSYFGINAISVDSTAATVAGHFQVASAARLHALE